jgi:predicted hotdog family 3-hydroxylacyl-ACP dehydratase
MVLLDAVLRWDAREIVCSARSHLDPDNPLRRDGRLGAVCGVEYGLQAAALHGGLQAGRAPLAAGLLAALPSVTLHATRLDDPSFGVLQVTARLEGRDGAGLAYAFALAAANGTCLIEGRGLIALARKS